MPLRQTIGFSLVLLMASAGAMAKAPDKGASHHATSSSRARSAHRSGHFYWPARLAFHRGGQSRHRHEFSAARSGAAPAGEWVATGTAGYQEVGAAAWYDLVGSRTSTGERLDTVTATAAHRTLPLGSCAKVTSLDTGRSVIVRINDRGPYSRRFIIDLSPRAAEELGMVHAGTAAVVVQPVATPPATAVAPTPTLADYRGQRRNLTQ